MCVEYLWKEIHKTGKGRRHWLPKLEVKDGERTPKKNMKKYSWSLICVWMYGLLMSSYARAHSATRHAKQTYFISVSKQHIQQLEAMAVRREIGHHLNTFVVHQGTLQALKKKGIPFSIRGQNALTLPSAFLSLQDVYAAFKRLAVQYPDRAEWIRLDQALQAPKTFEKRPLWALRIQYPLTDKKPRPVVLLDSIHHARELITPLVTLDAARQLVTQFDQVPEVRRWLKQYSIWIVPIVNPDGYHFVFTQDPLWRKNRRPHPSGHVGVDLNRNYPFLWGFCGRNSPMPSSEIYKGASAASEPEVQTLLRLAEQIRPQLYLSYHAYGNEVLRPYVCKPSGEESFLQEMTVLLAQAAGYRWRKASSSGESFEHMYNRLGTMSFLIEVGRAFQPKVHEIGTEIQAAQHTWKALLRRGLQASLQGYVVDALGQPIEADLSIDSIVFQAQEIRRSAPSTGWFFWLLRPGTYTFRVQAAGYQPWSKRIIVPVQGPLKLKVVLQKRVSQEHPVDDRPYEPPSRDTQYVDDTDLEVRASTEEVTSEKRDSEKPDVSSDMSFDAGADTDIHDLSSRELNDSSRSKEARRNDENTPYSGCLGCSTKKIPWDLDFLLVVYFIWFSCGRKKSLSVGRSEQV